MSAVNLVHHISIVSQANLGLPRPPYAAISYSSQYLLHLLLEKADYALSQHGETRYLLFHLVVRWTESLGKIGALGIVFWRPGDEDDDILDDLLA